MEIEYLLMRIEFAIRIMESLALSASLAPPIIDVHRVRPIIEQLPYDYLVRKGIVPDLFKFTPNIVVKRYPPWLYALSKTYTNIYCDFGRFVENILYLAIMAEPIDYSSIWSSVSNIPIPIQLQSANNFVGGIVSWVKSQFNGQAVEHEPELNYKSIQGHPDLLCHDPQLGTWILEIKTTSAFKKMAPQAFLQVLAYCSLARGCGYSNRYIGLLLPLQRQIIWYDVSNWDDRPYRKRLIEESEHLTHLYNPIFALSCEPQEEAYVDINIIGLLGRRVMSPIIGSHYSKKVMFIPELAEIKTPIQIHTTNPQGEHTLIESEIVAMMKYIKPHTILFIHGPYIINLAKYDSRNIPRIKHELIVGQRINARGVVFHVGKYMDSGLEAGLQQMEANIRAILDTATEQCPFLLETPAGEGTELCTEIDDFIAFCDRFSDTRKFGAVVDFCHVHCAGYDPFMYLERLIIERPGLVRLVHFNDAKGNRGCCCDGHFPAGLGHIGYKTLWNCHELCRIHNIPMLTE